MNENLYEVPDEIEKAEHQKRLLWQGYLEAEKALAQIEKKHRQSNSSTVISTDILTMICLAAKEYAKKSESQEAQRKVDALEQVIAARNELEDSYKAMYKESQDELQKALETIKRLEDDKILLEEAIESFREDKKALMRTIEIQVLGE